MFDRSLPIPYPNLTLTCCSGAEYNQHLFHMSLQQFNAALRQGWLVRLWSALIRRSSSLVALDELQHRLISSHFAGIQAVPISQICGSEGRVKDFDSRFHPRSERSRSRWLSVAMARLQGIALPPVSLVQIGNRYFVRDGHHRISVAQAWGEKAIDAEIIVWNIAGEPAREVSLKSTLSFLPQETQHLPGSVQVGG